MLSVELELCLSKGITWPDHSVNLEKFTVEREDENIKTVRYQGFVSNELLLQYITKNQNETIVKDGKIIKDQYIEITKLTIDGILIPYHMIEKLSQYVPVYRTDFLEYCKNENIDINYGPIQTIKFWHAGTWSMIMGSNFWFKYKKARQSTLHSDFTGNSRDEIQNSIARIRSFL